MEVVILRDAANVSVTNGILSIALPMCDKDTVLTCCALSDMAHSGRTLKFWYKGILYELNGESLVVSCCTSCLGRWC